MAKLLTQKQYATRKGVSAQYINKLVQQSKIVLVDRKVDPKQADQAIAMFARPGRVTPRPGRVTPAKRAARKATAKAAGKKSAAKRKAGRPAPRRKVQTEKPTSATRSLNSARAEREHYQAGLAKLDYEERLGKLLPADEVIAAEQRKNANLRTRLRKVARIVAPMCARMTSAAEIEQHILSEIDAQLEMLAADPLGLVPIVEMPAAEAVQTFAEIPPVLPAEVPQINEEANDVEKQEQRIPPVSNPETCQAGA